jgi:hypothetical protein
MVKIYFKDIKIDKITNSSGVFYGENFQAKWKHSSKTNEGFGKVSGDKNTLKGNYNLTVDPDTIDSIVINTKNNKN